MNDAIGYIVHIKSILISEPSIVELKIVREESQGLIGLYRYRLTFENGDLVEMFEKFTVKSGRAEVTKYSFQWQDGNGVLRKRWDNAAHHPELSTYPDHVHTEVDDIVLPYSLVTAVDVLKVITGDWQSIKNTSEETATSVS